MADPIIRPVTRKDTAAVRLLFQDVLTFQLALDPLALVDNAAAVPPVGADDGLGSLVSPIPTTACVVAEIDGRVVGAILTSTINLQAACRQGGKLPFDIFRETTADMDMVVVHALAVAREHQRRGIGTDLVHAGVRTLSMGSSRMAGTIFITPQGDVASNEFIETLYFRVFGRLDHYLIGKGRGAGPRSAILWLLPTDSAMELEEYVPTPAERAEEGELVALDSDPLIRERKVKRMAPWLRTCLLYYVLPLVAVAVLYFFCYLAVVYGPLRGPTFDNYFTPPAFAAGAAEWNAKRAAAASASAAAEAMRKLGAAAGGRLQREEL